MNLRDYQLESENDIYTAWQTYRNVLFQSHTGSGKTVVFSHIISDFKGLSCVIAHRQEIVMQISLTLATNGVFHAIIAPTGVITNIIAEHMKEFGKCYYDHTASVTLASVQTLINRYDKIPDWFDRVGLWVIDEAHHVLRSNQWGRCVELFKNAFGLGVTATPCRASSEGLGRTSDGVFDTLIEGKSMRWLIENGYLCDYKIYSPTTYINLANVKISSATGDFVKPQLNEVVAESTIVGDVVASYLKHAKGKKGLTFCTSVDVATQIAQAYNDAGVRAEVLSAKSNPIFRQQTIRDFRNGELMQLVNVDLFGEGFDVPGVEVVSMARPTCSYALYSQIFGRALRVLLGKLHAIIIDHVGNVYRHGLPDSDRVWSLERVERASKAKEKSEIPTKSCPQCTYTYEAYLKGCPECGHVPQPISRDEPKHVMGDLEEMSQELLDALRNKKAYIDCDANIIANSLRKGGASPIAIAGAVKNHYKRKDLQQILRLAINTWYNSQISTGRQSGEVYKRFYNGFKIDMLTAQSLGKPEAIKLCLKICEEL